MPEAVACYRRALELKPDYAEAHNNLGIALKEQGNLEEAAACYLRALRLDPLFVKPCYNLAAVREEGSVDEAIASYRQAVKLKPDYAQATIIWALCSRGKETWTRPFYATAGPSS